MRSNSDYEDDAVIVISRHQVDDGCLKMNWASDWHDDIRCVPTGSCLDGFQISDPHVLLMWGVEEDWFFKGNWRHLISLSPPVSMWFWRTEKAQVTITTPKKEGIKHRVIMCGILNTIIRKSPLFSAYSTIRTFEGCWSMGMRGVVKEETTWVIIEKRIFFVSEFWCFNNELIGNTFKKIRKKRRKLMKHELMNSLHHHHDEHFDSFSLQNFERWWWQVLLLPLFMLMMKTHTIINWFLLSDHHSHHDDHHEHFSWG